MKNKTLNNIFYFLLGAILFSFITAYATGSIGANEVLYDNSESGLTSENMQGAINELYDKANYGDAVAGNILSGKTALVQGSTVTGSMPNKGDHQTAVSMGKDNTGVWAYFPYGYYSQYGSTGNAYIYMTADQLGTTTAGNVLSGQTFTSSNGVKITGTMTNNGATGGTINPGGSYTIPAGYTSGGTVKANANQNSGTYTPTSRSSSLDMGANNTYRYVNTNSVPNTNSGTYTYAANSTGGTVDLGATNTYRYVNAANVYAKGQLDAKTFTAIYTSKYYSASTSNIAVSIPNVTSYKYLIIHYQNGENQFNEFGYVTVSSKTFTKVYSSWTDRAISFSTSGTTGTINLGTNKSSSYLTVYGI